MRGAHLRWPAGRPRSSAAARKKARTRPALPPTRRRKYDFRQINSTHTTLNPVQKKFMDFMSKQPIRNIITSKQWHKYKIKYIVDAIGKETHKL